MNTPRNGKYDKVVDNFWNNVDLVLKERGMASMELAKKLGISPKTLSSKKASRCNVSIASAKEMAEAMGTSIERLVYGDPKAQ